MFARPPIQAALLSALVLSGLPSAARADFLTFGITGTVTWVQGASAARPVELGMPFQAVLWFDPGPGGWPGSSEFQPLRGGVGVRVGSMSFVSDPESWGLFARIGLHHYYVPNPDDYEGRTPIMEPYVRFDSGPVRLEGGAGGLFAGLNFGYAWGGPAVPSNRWLTDLNRATPAASGLWVGEADGATPFDQRFGFGGDMTSIGKSVTGHPTPEPATLALAGVGAGVALLARWAGRRRPANGG